MLESNYETNLNTLTTNINYQIYSVEGIMNPTKVETIIEKTVDFLTELYEKSRLLDELYYHVQEKLSEDIEKEIQKIRKLISFIENNIDSYQTTACFSKNIEFVSQSPIKILKDRDGSILLKANVKNGLTLPYENTILTIDKINKESSDYYYKDNLLNINKGAEVFYKSFYSLEQPNTITEKISFLFDTPVDLNKFDLSAYGADVIHISAENTESEIVEIPTDRQITDIYSDLKKVIVELQSNKFKKKKVDTDTADFTVNQTFGGIV